MMEKEEAAEKRGEKVVGVIEPKEDFLEKSKRRL